MKFSVRLAAALAASALALSACAGPSATPNTGSAAPTQSEPVKLTFWHSASGASADTINEMITEFNETNAKNITVEAIYQGGYNDALAKLVNAASSTGIPDVMQITDTQAGFMVDSKLTTPIEALMPAGPDADNLADVMPVARSYYTIDGSLQAMPFQVSVPLIYANKAILAQAGLDASKGPQTVAELGQWAQQIKDKTGTAGLTLGMNSFWMEELTASAGELYCTPDNGLKDPAEAVNYSTDKQVAHWTMIQDLVKSRAILNVGQAGADAQNAFGNQTAGMLMASSSNLGNVTKMLPDGFVVFPYPVDDKTNGGIVPSGNALWALTKDKSEDIKAASATFISFMGSPEQQAKSFERTGYLPNSNAAVAIAEPKATEVGQVVLKSFLEATSTPITGGCHSGAMASLRSGASQPAIDKIVAGEDVKAALQEAEAKGKELIAEYNKRAGK